MKFVLSSALAAVLLAVSSASMAQSNLTTIRFVAAPSDDLVPFWYAQSTGMFKAAGLNVEASSVSTGAVVTQAVIGGAADIGRTSPQVLIAAHIRGIPLVVVAPGAIHRQNAQGNAAIVVAANSPLKSVLDLQGKTVSCTAIGDVGYLGLRALIDAQGGDSSTVKWIEIPIPAAAAALDAGRIDAGLSTEPFMTRDVAGGKVRVLVDMLNGYPGTILQGVYFSTRAFADANADAVGRFARVLREASVYTNAHVAETLPLVVANTGLDADVASKMHRTTMALSLDPAEFQPLIDVAAKYKQIPQRFDARDMFWAPPR
ncbi:MAG: ABC transporter substrate-binding protein [Candidatus Lustribacter sp.]|jgi:NitT/TauT family transport system substrate-binding protein